MTKPIGLHIHSTRADAMAARYIETVRPSVVKWLEEGISPGLVRLAKSHGALTVGRVYEPDQDLGKAGAFFDRLERAIIRHPDIDVWEGYNESHQGGRELAARAVFDIDLMKLCASHGKRAAIGSFSVGNPQLEHWQHYAPALKYASELGHYVALHEYSAPTMQWGAGLNQVGNLRGGRWDDIDLARGDVSGWFTLRYRQAVSMWRRLGVSPVPRIIITESGLDNIHPRPDVGTRRGYKTYQGTEYYGHADLGDYAAQLRWMAEHWQQDHYIVGGVDFGFADASGEWDDFDLSTDPATFERVIEEMRGLADTVPRIPQMPPTQPAGEVDPRITGAVDVYAIPSAGESPAAFAARAAGLSDARWPVRRALWDEMREHNGLQFDRIQTGRPYRVPWFRVGAA